MRVSYRLWRLRARALEAAEACSDRHTPWGVGHDRYKPRLAPTFTPYGGIHTDTRWLINWLVAKFDATCSVSKQLRGNLFYIFISPSVRPGKQEWYPLMAAPPIDPAPK